MRCIDRVTAPGSNDIQELWTCDVDLANLEEKIRIGEVDKYNMDKLSRAEKKRVNYRNRIKRQTLSRDVLEDKVDIH